MSNKALTTSQPAADSIFVCVRVRSVPTRNDSNNDDAQQQLSPQLSGNNNDTIAVSVLDNTIAVHDPKLLNAHNISDIVAEDYQRLMGGSGSALAFNDTVTTLNSPSLTSPTESPRSAVIPSAASSALTSALTCMTFNSCCVSMPKDQVMAMPLIKYSDFLSYDDICAMSAAASTGNGDEDEYTFARNSSTLDGYLNDNNTTNPTSNQNYNNNTIPRCLRGSQYDLYQTTAAHAVSAALEGINACVFGYGQTGSGKTYTMFGGDVSNLSGYQPGIVPRAMKDIFASLDKKKREFEENVAAAAAAREGASFICGGDGSINGGVGDHNDNDEEWLSSPNSTMNGKATTATTADQLKFTFEVKIGFLEIYQKEVGCLISNKRNLNIREGGNNGPFVENLCVTTVKSADEALRLIEAGLRRRRTGGTRMNAESSRSHAILQVHVKQTAQQCRGKQTTMLSSMVNLVDLAGSERQKTALTAGASAKEGTEINLSLSHLSRVINEVAAASNNPNGNNFVNYRGSKLTHLLKESLGGNCRTFMIAAVSPTVDCYQETISTLKYARSVQSIRNKPTVNKKLQMRADLQEEVATLRRELQHARHQLEMYTILLATGAAATAGDQQLLSQHIAAQEDHLDDVSEQLSARSQQLADEEATLIAMGEPTTSPRAAINVDDDANNDNNAKKNGNNNRRSSFVTIIGEGDDNNNASAQPRPSSWLSGDVVNQPRSRIPSQRLSASGPTTAAAAADGRRMKQNNTTASSAFVPLATPSTNNLPFVLAATSTTTTIHTTDEGNSGGADDSSSNSGDCAEKSEKENLNNDAGDQLTLTTTSAAASTFSSVPIKTHRTESVYFKPLPSDPEDPIWSCQVGPLLFEALPNALTENLSTAVYDTTFWAMLDPSIRRRTTTNVTKVINGIPMPVMIEEEVEVHVWCNNSSQEVSPDAHIKLYHGSVLRAEVTKTITSSMGASSEVMETILVHFLDPFLVTSAASQELHLGRSVTAHNTAANSTMTSRAPSMMRKMPTAAKARSASRSMYRTDTAMTMSRGASPNFNNNNHNHNDANNNSNSNAFDDDDVSDTHNDNDDDDDDDSRAFSPPPVNVTHCRPPMVPKLFLGLSNLSKTINDDLLRAAAARGSVGDGSSSHPDEDNDDEEEEEIAVDGAAEEEHTSSAAAAPMPFQRETAVVVGASSSPSSTAPSSFVVGGGSSADGTPLTTTSTAAATAGAAQRHSHGSDFTELQNTTMSVNPAALAFAMSSSFAADDECSSSSTPAGTNGNFNRTVAADLVLNAMMVGTPSPATIALAGGASHDNDGDNGNDDNLAGSPLAVNPHYAAAAAAASPVMTAAVMRSPMGFELPPLHNTTNASSRAHSRAANNNNGSPLVVGILKNSAATSPQQQHLMGGRLATSVSGSPKRVSLSFGGVPVKPKQDAVSGNNNDNDNNNGAAATPSSAASASAAASTSIPVMVNGLPSSIVIPRLPLKQLQREASKLVERTQRLDEEIEYQAYRRSLSNVNNSTTTVVNTAAAAAATVDGDVKGGENNGAAGRASSASSASLPPTTRTEGVSSMSPPRNNQNNATTATTNSADDTPLSPPEAHPAANVASSISEPRCDASPSAAGSASPLLHRRYEALGVSASAAASLMNPNRHNSVSVGRGPSTASAAAHHLNLMIPDLNLSLSHALALRAGSVDAARHQLLIDELQRVTAELMRRNAVVDKLRLQMATMKAEATKYAASAEAQVMTASAAGGVQEEEEPATAATEFRIVGVEDARKSCAYKEEMTASSAALPLGVADNDNDNGEECCDDAAPPVMGRTTVELLVEEVADALAEVCDLPHKHGAEFTTTNRNTAASAAAAAPTSVNRRVDYASPAKGTAAVHPSDNDDGAAASPQPNSITMNNAAHTPSSAVSPAPQATKNAPFARTASVIAGRSVSVTVDEIRRAIDEGKELSDLRIKCEGFAMSDRVLKAQVANLTQLVEELQEEVNAAYDAEAAHKAQMHARGQEMDLLVVQLDAAETLLSSEVEAVESLQKELSAATAVFSSSSSSNNAIIICDQLQARLEESKRMCDGWRRKALQLQMKLMKVMKEKSANSDNQNVCAAAGSSDGNSDGDNNRTSHHSVRDSTNSNSDKNILDVVDPASVAHLAMTVADLEKVASDLLTEREDLHTEVEMLRHSLGTVNEELVGKTNEATELKAILTDMTEQLQLKQEELDETVLRASTGSAASSSSAAVAAKQQHLNNTKGAIQLRDQIKKLEAELSASKAKEADLTKRLKGTIERRAPLMTSAATAPSSSSTSVIAQVAAASSANVAALKAKDSEISTLRGDVAVLKSELGLTMTTLMTSASPVASNESASSSVNAPSFSTSNYAFLAQADVYRAMLTTIMARVDAMNNTNTPDGASSSSSSFSLEDHAAVRLGLKLLADQLRLSSATHDSIGSSSSSSSSLISFATTNKATVQRIMDTMTTIATASSSSSPSSSSDAFFHSNVYGELRAIISDILFAVVADSSNGVAAASYPSVLAAGSKWGSIDNNKAPNVITEAMVSEWLLNGGSSSSSSSSSAALLRRNTTRLTTALISFVVWFDNFDICSSKKDLLPYCEIVRNADVIMTMASALMMMSATSSSSGDAKKSASSSSSSVATAEFIDRIRHQLGAFKTTAVMTTAASATNSSAVPAVISSSSKHNNAASSSSSHIDTAVRQIAGRILAEAIDAKHDQNEKSAQMALERERSVAASRSRPRHSISPSSASPHHHHRHTVEERVFSSARSQSVVTAHNNNEDDEGREASPDLLLPARHAVASSSSSASPPLPRAVSVPFVLTSPLSEKPIHLRYERSYLEELGIELDDCCSAQKVEEGVTKKTEEVNSPAAAPAPSDEQPPATAVSVRAVSVHQQNNLYDDDDADEQQQDDEDDTANIPVADEEEDEWARTQLEELARLESFFKGGAEVSGVSAVSAAVSPALSKTNSMVKKNTTDATQQKKNSNGRASASVSVMASQILSAEMLREEDVSAAAAATGADNDDDDNDDCAHDDDDFNLAMLKQVESQRNSEVGIASVVVGRESTGLGEVVNAFSSPASTKISDAAAVAASMMMKLSGQSTVSTASQQFLMKAFRDSNASVDANGHDAVGCAAAANVHASGCLASRTLSTASAAAVSMVADHSCHQCGDDDDDYLAISAATSQIHSIKNSTNFTAPAEGNEEEVAPPMKTIHLTAMTMTAAVNNDASDEAPPRPSMFNSTANSADQNVTSADASSEKAIAILNANGAADDISNNNDGGSLLLIGRTSSIQQSMSTTASQQLVRCSDANSVAAANPFGRHSGDQQMKNETDNNSNNRFVIPSPSNINSAMTTGQDESLSMRLSVTAAFVDHSAMRLQSLRLSSASVSGGGGGGNDHNHHESHDNASDGAIISARPSSLIPATATPATMSNNSRFRSPPPPPMTAVAVKKSSSTLATPAGTAIRSAANASSRKAATNNNDKTATASSSSNVRSISPSSLMGNLKGFVGSLLGGGGSVASTTSATPQKKSKKETASEVLNAAGNKNSDDNDVNDGLLLLSELRKSCEKRTSTNAVSGGSPKYVGDAARNLSSTSLKEDDLVPSINDKNNEVSNSAVANPTHMVNGNNNNPFNSTVGSSVSSSSVPPSSLTANKLSAQNLDSAALFFAATEQQRQEEEDESITRDIENMILASAGAGASHHSHTSSPALSANKQQQKPVMDRTNPFLLNSTTTTTTTTAPSSTHRRHGGEGSGSFNSNNGSVTPQPDDITAADRNGSGGASSSAPIRSFGSTLRNN